MSLSEQLVHYIQTFSTYVELEVFVALGSFIEEIIAPIPSPLVMVLSGSMAHAQNLSLWHLLFLAAIGAVGKAVGAWVLYSVADKLEDVVIGKLGRFMGVTHVEVESIGKKMAGGWRDVLFLTIARGVPIIPSAPVSIACGVIKLDLKLFLGTTFAGTFFRNMLYLYIGFAGLSNYTEIAGGVESLESIGKIVLLLVVVGFVGWAYTKRGSFHK